MLVALLNICNEEELKEEATNSPLTGQNLTDGNIIIYLKLRIKFHINILKINNI